MTTDSATVALPERMFEYKRLLWRAKPGATSTFEESVEARELFIELHANQFWNPWDFEERAADLERAEEIMQEWERAEPGFKRKTKRQVDAKMARWDREFERERVQREQQRQKNLKCHDPEREQARLALLEYQSILAHKVDEVARLRSGEAFPAMDSKRRADQVAELGEAAVRFQAETDRLTPIVGDPEDVVDQNGHLPADRRPAMLYRYRQHRIDEVTELRAKIPELEAAIKVTEDRAERSKLRAERDVKKSRLEKLLAVPRLEAEDMCADCPTPVSKHGRVSPPADHPCSAWPGWGARLRETWKMLEEMAARNEARKAAGTPPPPKPEPLAVIPSGLTIAQVVHQLQELQVRFPDAVVRRGRANRWELWAKADAASE